MFALLVPQMLLQSAYPLASTLYSLGFSVVFLLVMPFIQGGMFGMADEALTARSSLSRFVTDGRANYLQLLVAYVLLLVVNSVIGAVGVAAGFGALLAHGSIGMVFIGLVAISALVYLSVAFFIQFYGQAIVIDDLGAVDGLKHSYAVVRRNLVSTLGYSVFVGILGGVAGGVFTIASMLVSPQSTTVLSLPQLSVVATVGVALLIVIFGALFGGFFTVYSVAFYRTIGSEVIDGS
ncbi:hypothetical protein GCM10009039_34070 [Halocalculus aciditolerans]|uniref:DUF7847 domain-containing protein n=1 Tax=Halocalculus aciditolerans TaxID=1383812 RepID=A0A830FNJ8_9EURY|nr:hypothetical protein GCM10009039_34070 [Halocalculus aciditolerans]